MTDTDGPIRLDALLAHAGWLQGLTRALVGDPHAAADVTQETWLAAIEHPPRFEGSPRGWLYRVARNAAHAMRLKDLRRNRREKIAARPEGIPDPSSVVERVELAQRLAGMIQSLDEPYRTTIVLRYLEGWTTAEIAARSGRPASTVRSHVERGLVRLRQMLDREHGGRRGAWTALLVPFLGLDAVIRSPGGVAVGAVLGGALVGKKIAVALVLLVILVAGVVVSGLFSSPDDALPPAPVPRVAAPEEVREPEVAEVPTVISEVPEEPAETPETPVAVPPPPPEPIRIVVKDMATGGAVPDLRFRCGDRVLTTDAGGAVLVAPERLASLTPIPEGPWRRAKARPARQGSEEHVLWIYRMMQVRGRLTSESTVAKLDITKVKLVAVSDRPIWDGPGPTGKILAQSHMSRIKLRRALMPDGSFQVEIPCVQGYRLAASAPGWQPDSAALQATPSQFVSLRLTKPSIAIRGTVRDTSGAPLSGAYISVYVIIVMPLTELDRGAVKAVGHGYTLGTNRVKNRAVLKYQVVAKTGPDGSFEAEVNAKGRLVVVVKPRGDFHTTTVERKSFDDDIDGLDLTVAPGDGRMVRVERSGVPFHGSVYLVDVTKTEQNVVGVNLKDSNEFYMAKLIMGHQYAVHIRGELAFSRHLIWDGRSVIDLATLKKEADLSLVSPEKK